MSHALKFLSHFKIFRTVICNLNIYIITLLPQNSTKTIEIPLTSSGTWQRGQPRGLSCPQCSPWRWLPGVCGTWATRCGRRRSLVWHCGDHRLCHCTCGAACGPAPRCRGSSNRRVRENLITAMLGWFISY